jgi:hypothetical protein
MLQGVWRNGFTRSRNGSEQLWDGGAKTDSGVRSYVWTRIVSEQPSWRHAKKRYAQPIQGNNPPVFDVSGPIRAGGGSNPIEQFLATLNPVQREPIFSFTSRTTASLC